MLLAKDSFLESLVRFSVLASLAHSLVYLVLIKLFPEVIAGTFLAENFFTSLRWLDPSLWLFWFVGWSLLKRGVILTTARQHGLLVAVGIVVYSFCILPALFFGFVFGLAILLFALFLAMSCAFFGRRGNMQT